MSVCGLAWLEACCCERACDGARWCMLLRGGVAVRVGSCWCGWCVMACAGVRPARVGAWWYVRARNGVRWCVSVCVGWLYV